VIRLGGRQLDPAGLDLLGVIVGSEGLLGVVTEVTVRILPRPERARAVLLGFPSVESAGQCVADVIAGGIIPAGLEMMDALAIHAAEAYAKVGYPLDVPAVGRISPDYYCMDGTIPRRRLPQVLRRMETLSEQYGLAVANVFHAGDGNLHPLILYDANAPGELDRAESFGADILRLCVEVGGVLTGEHGVGVEKRDLMPVMFTETDLAHQQRVKCAFDPDLLLNPGKVFPTLHRCAELGRVHVHRGQTPFPDLPRF
jgi:glycolate oxidase